MSASITITTSSLESNLHKDIADIDCESEVICDVFPEFSKNPTGEPAKIPPHSSSTISHNNISFTTHLTLFSISYTANSHTQFHTTDHLHHTNTTAPTDTTAPTTTSIITLTTTISPKQPPYKKIKNTACTTSTASTTKTSSTTSINKSAPTILPKERYSIRTKQSTQITITKRNPPKLSPFISTVFRLKCPKKYPFPFIHHRTSLTKHPTPPSPPVPNSPLPPS